MCPKPPFRSAKLRPVSIFAKKSHFRALIFNSGQVVRTRGFTPVIMWENPKGERAMNKIEFPMKVLAVKLEYRRLKLEKMVKGFFRDVKGKPCVFITTDPAIPKLSTRHPRIISVNSKTGKVLAEKIKEYQTIKAEYDQLLVSWYALYNLAPPRISFPIIQYSDPHRMNNAYFNAQADRLGKYTPDTPTVSEHGDLKSKNELIGTDLLKDMGIPFKYETKLYLKEIEETINPDCLVNFYEIDRCAYLEILGMNDKFDYFVKTSKKIYGYSKDNYRPGREVIYIILYDKANFDKDYFVSQVLTAFNDMIPDNALIWEENQAAV